MLFLVDGYNVTKSDPATRELDLESQREALVSRLRACGSAIFGAGRIVVFFDAQGSVAPVALRDTAPVKVVFARSGSADDAIVREVKTERARVTVVTNDRGLLQRVRAHAVGSVTQLASSACFEGAGKGASRKGKRPSPARDVGVPRGANSITEELKRIWLQDDE